MAPTLNDPKLLTEAMAVFAVLSPGPRGNPHDEPVFAITPISVLANVANVEPSSAAFHANCRSQLPAPAMRLIFQAALITFCFSEGAKGGPFTVPLEVIPSNTLTAKADG